ncbi:hypothetical protein LCGC14_1047420 [marine sediment metagenome]|uniref:Uncharacterized protein n=1 Tax=marine sediment metagenome TaxID=412755 RepID=A0A0F9NBN4_9ZZZZ
MAINKDDGGFSQGCDWDAIYRGIEKKGTFSGLAAAEQGTPAMAVDVASGQVVDTDTNAVINVSSDAVTITAADTDGTRYDLGYIDNANTIQIVDGSVNSQTPNVADLPATALTPIFVVKVESNTTVINDSNIRDLRTTVGQPAIQYIEDNYSQAWKLEFLGTATGTFTAAAGATNVCSVDIAESKLNDNDQIVCRATVDKLGTGIIGVNMALQNSNSIDDKIIRASEAYTNDGYITADLWSNGTDSERYSALSINDNQTAAQNSPNLGSRSGIWGVNWMTNAQVVYVKADNNETASTQSQVRLSVWRKIGA